MQRVGRRLEQNRLPAKSLQMAARLRWGILGAGRISNDFVCALRSTGAHVAAVAASSLDKAQAFAARHGLSIHLGVGAGNAVNFCL